MKYTRIEPNQLNIEAIDQRTLLLFAFVKSFDPFKQFEEFHK